MKGEVPLNQCAVCMVESEVEHHLNLVTADLMQPPRWHSTRMVSSAGHTFERCYLLVCDQCSELESVQRIM